MKTSFPVAKIPSSISSLTNRMARLLSTSRNFFFAALTASGSIVRCTIQGQAASNGIRKISDKVGKLVGLTNARGSSWMAKDREDGEMFELQVGTFTPTYK